MGRVHNVHSLAITGHVLHISYRAQSIALHKVDAAYTSREGFVLGQWRTVARVSRPVRLVLRSLALRCALGAGREGGGGAEATRAGPYMGELGPKNYTGVTSKMTLRHAY